MHAFLSYSREDVPIVTKVKEVLLAAEVPFWGGDDLTPDTPDWQPVIQEKLSEAACIVVFCSPAIRKSKWGNHDIEYGMTHKKPIIPLLISGDASTAIPDRLATISYMDVRTSIEPIWLQLVPTIRHTYGVVSSSAQRAMWFHTAGSKLERFTRPTRTVFQFAQDQAEQMQHPLVGPEHLFLGLIREDTGTAGRLLREISTVSDVQQMIARLLNDKRDAGPPSGLTPATKRALQLARNDAIRMNSIYIGTAHLLFAVIRSKRGSSVPKLLRELGINSGALPHFM